MSYKSTLDFNSCAKHWLLSLHWGTAHQIRTIKDRKNGQIDKSRFLLRHAEVRFRLWMDSWTWLDPCTQRVVKWFGERFLGTQAEPTESHLHATVYTECCSWPRSFPLRPQFTQLRNFIKHESSHSQLVPRRLMYFSGFRSESKSTHLGCGIIIIIIVITTTTTTTIKTVAYNSTVSYE